MDDASPKVCFTDLEVLKDFMDEFAPDGSDEAAKAYYQIILFRISRWQTAKMDYIVPGRARIIGMRPRRRKEVMLVTHVIRFNIDFH